MGIMDEIIDDFVKTNKIMVTEPPIYASYYPTNEQQNIIDALESSGCLVFHATREFTEFGELLTLLIVSQYKEDNRYIYEDARNGLVYCYVKNLTDDWCSEYGTCQFKLTPSGDIKRII